MAGVEASGTGGGVPAPSAGAPSVTAVVSDFPAPSQTFILRKLRGLRDAGLDVTVAASRFATGAAGEGFRTVPLLPWSDPRSVLRPSGRAGWAPTLRGLARPHGWGPRQLAGALVQAPVAGLDTDVVHFEFSGLAVTYLGALDRLRVDHRIAVSCRGAAEQIEPLKDPARAAALREVFDRADLVHCVSEDMRRTVVGYGAPEERILVNRPAVPVGEFVDLRAWHGDDDGPLRLLSIGRLHWKKGIDDALRVVAELRRRGTDVTYRVVGEGVEREKLTFLVDQLGISDRVELLGARTTQEVRASLAWAQVLLLPSLSEGISNAVLEAMAAGRAVVTTDCGGMAEVTTDGEDAFVVGVGDVPAMADRIESLAADADLRARLGAAAATRADAEFDISRQVRRFVDAYRSLA